MAPRSTIKALPTTPTSQAAPSSAHEGIWEGMRAAINGASDIRFTCRLDRNANSQTVDLNFYNIGWYRELTASRSDANVCFEESNGSGDTQPTPRRRNNLNGQTRSWGINGTQAISRGKTPAATPATSPSTSMTAAWTTTKAMAPTGARTTARKSAARAPVAATPRGRSGCASPRF